MKRAAAARLGDLAHAWGCAPRQEYAYLLGLYLGDGSISRHRSTQRLRITLDLAYPGIIAECRNALATLMPFNNVGVVKRPGRCVDVSCYSQLWAYLLPQHGAGPKHLRPIRLEPWQEHVVAYEPRAFIRGLFHSDGSYFQNPVKAPSGKRYSYDRYYFTNRSEDIKDLFIRTCSLVGVDTRRVGAMNVSVAKRDSVARLNEFLGPKR